MKKIFLALAALIAMTSVSCVRDESTYFHITDVKGVVINEVYTFSDQSEADDLDWIELYNTTNEDIDLTDVLLWEGGGSEEAWAFPKGTIIAAKGHLVVDCDKYGLLNNPVKYPAWGLSKGPEEFIVLANSDMTVIDEIALPSMNENESYGRVTDGAAEWQIFQNGTKGVKNEGPARGQFVNTCGLYVNEVYHDNSDEFIADGWDASIDWIEFYNSTSADFDISGYALYDDKHEEETKFVFPEGTVVPAGGFFTIYVDKDDPTNPSFGLGAGGDWLFLHDKAGEVVEEIEIPAFSKESGLRNHGYTFGRKPDGSTNLVIFKTATRNASNNNAEVLETIEEPSEPDQPSQPDQPSHTAGLVLNELNGNEKYIELYNNSDSEINLEGYTMYKDEEFEEPIWVGQEGMKIAAKGYLKLDSNKNSADYTKEFGSGLSAGKSVAIELRDKDGKTLDSFVRGKADPAWGDQKLTENTDASFSRVPDGTGDWAYAAPTPGASNGNNKTGDIEGYTPSVTPSQPDQPSQTAGLVLNELNGNEKYIELYNNSDSEINLEGYTMYKDEEFEEPIWVGQEGMKIAAKGYLKLDSNKNSADYTKEFGSGLSAGKSVAIELRDKDGKTLDSFVRGKADPAWGDQKLTENTDASFSRVPDGTGDWAYAAPTPGASNGNEKTGDIEHE